MHEHTGSVQIVLSGRLRQQCMACAWRDGWRMASVLPERATEVRRSVARSGVTCSSMTHSSVTRNGARRIGHIALG